MIKEDNSVSMTNIDAGMLKKAILAGAKNLEMNKEQINELNVFPVPDGDTGTNMTMTILSAAREVSSVAAPDFASLSRAMSFGSLRGARGNSGVILSQLFRGFAKEIKECDGITVTVLANALGRGTETAYKAVMKPKEGTILTVARGISEKAAELALETDDILEFCDQVLARGDAVLEQTPEMLPVLKEAGVVDSGGMGLMTVLKGAVRALKGEELGELAPQGTMPVTDHAGIPEAGVEDESIKFGYCTEFIINIRGGGELKEEERESFRSYLESIGDSIVFVDDESIVKVHVHTNEPGNAIQRALTYGYLTNMKIDNMRVEHREKLIHDAEKMALEQEAARKEKKAQEKKAAAAERKPYALIAVSAGKGLSEIFRGVGATDVIEGGQTMNPSTEDILNAAAKANADVVYIFPNNKNIILAANQASAISEDCRIVVVPSKTIPQGIAAIISFAPDMTDEENLVSMSDEMSRVKTGEITYAVRDTTIDGRPIHKDDMMAIGDDGLLAVGKEPEETVLMALKSMTDEDSELITIYYGEGISQEKAEEMAEIVRKEFPDCEVEIHDGGQPVYYYLLSVE